ncbi:MAG: expansin (peptidoglycan-binding protein) [Crocinitomicaceae bacterium]|jgi:expansin (peptidoglycan-binding protein)
MGVHKNATDGTCRINGIENGCLEVKFKIIQAPLRDGVNARAKLSLAKVKLAAIEVNNTTLVVASSS